MKGLILAGGRATRLHPLTNTTNKHLLPIGRQPMLYHPLKCLKESGIKEVMIVTGKDHAGDIIEVFGSGSDMGLELTYRVQDQAGGIAQGIGLAREFVGNQNVAVILGDNMFDFTLGRDVAAFDDVFVGDRCHLFIKEVSDPDRFGVVQFAGSAIVGIEEKPKHPKSNFAVIGIYFYSPDVFARISDLKPSGRGELEVTDLNISYLRHGKLSYSRAGGFWSDAGTFETYRLVNDFIWSQYGGSFFD